MSDHDIWLILAEQYLNTSKNIMQQIVNCGNPWIMISDQPIEPQDYAEYVKWSDFNSLVPSMFLLMHGIELMLKGLVIWSDGSLLNYDHNPAILIDILNKDERITPSYLAMISKYVGAGDKNKLIADFREINNIVDSSSIHVTLRYPDSRNDKASIDFSSFQYKEQDIMLDLTIMINDIESMLFMTNEIIRKANVNSVNAS